MGCGRGLVPNFLGGRDDPNFYGRLLARIGVARIFRVWVRIQISIRGGSRISGWGTMEGSSKAPNEAR